jgi:hypothetical protein
MSMVITGDNSYDKGTLLPMEKSKFLKTEKGQIDDTEGIVYKEFAQAGQTVNSAN